MSDQFSKLVSGYLFGTATPEQILELERLIRQDRRMLSQFVRDAYLHRSSRDILAGASKARQFKTPTDSTPAGRSGASGAKSTADRSPKSGARAWLWRAGAGIAATAALAALAVGLWMPIGGQTQGSRNLAGMGEVIGGQVKVVGDRIAAEGTLAVLRHVDGAVIALAPESEIVLGDSKTELIAGQISVVYPSDSSKQMRVITSSIEIEDVGTEFSTEIKPDGSTEVDVLSGSVRLRGIGGGTVMTAVAGESWVASRDGTVTPTTWAADMPSVANSMMRIRQQGGAGWASFVQRLSDDPSLLLWTDCFSESGTSELANLVIRPGIVATRPNASTTVTAPGRFRGDSAMRVRGIDDAIAMVLPGQMESVTLMAWVRLNPEDPQTQRHRALLLSEADGEPGQLHWQVKGSDFRVSVRGEDGTMQGFVAMTDALAGDRWMMLATVIDGPARSVRHYVDGQMVYERLAIGSLPRLTLGKCWVGAWRGAQDTAGQFRALNGDLDEMMVWSRPLGAVEVSELARRSAVPQQNK